MALICTRARDGEREGRAAEFGRIDAEEQMVHDRIADEDEIQDVVAMDVAFLADLADQAEMASRTATVMPSRPSGFIIT